MSQEGTPMLPDTVAPGVDVPERCRLVSDVLARVGDKWSVLVVMTLGGGSRRFNELRRAIGSISQRMLTLTLRGLERDGLIARVATPSVPARVDYKLTALGRSLETPVSALGAWAIEHECAVRSSRSAFDASLAKADLSKL